MSELETLAGEGENKVTMTNLLKKLKTVINDRDKYKG